MKSKKRKKYNKKSYKKNFRNSYRKKSYKKKHIKKYINGGTIPLSEYDANLKKYNDIIQENIRRQFTTRFQNFHNTVISKLREPQTNTITGLVVCSYLTKLTKQMNMAFTKAKAAYESILINHNLPIKIYIENRINYSKINQLKKNFLTIINNNDCGDVIYKHDQLILLLNEIKNIATTMEENSKKFLPSTSISPQKPPRIRI